MPTELFLTFDRLSPLFLIQRTGDVYGVADLVVDAQRPDYWPDGGQLPIRGPAAHWLYVALSGHRFITSPDTFNPWLARAARGYIAECRPGGFYLAHLVVRDWGEFIVPWLGG